MTLPPPSSGTRYVGALQMDQDDKKKQPLERDTTDESLRAERRKTDAQLAGTLKNIKQNADDVVAEARNKADSVLSDARDREDRRLADEGPSDAMTQGLETHAPAKMRR